MYIYSLSIHRFIHTDIIQYIYIYIYIYIYYILHILSYRYNTVDICIAVSTEGGLITPIIPNADIKVSRRLLYAYRMDQFITSKFLV